MYQWNKLGKYNLSGLIQIQFLMNTGTYTFFLTVGSASVFFLLGGRIWTQMRKSDLKHCNSLFNSFERFLFFKSYILSWRPHLENDVFTLLITVCSRSLDPIHIVNYYIKWVKTSWIYSRLCRPLRKFVFGSVDNCMFNKTSWTYSRLCSPLSQFWNVRFLKWYIHYILTFCVTSCEYFNFDYGKLYLDSTCPNNADLFCKSLKTAQFFYSLLCPCTVFDNTKASDWLVGKEVYCTTYMWFRRLNFRLLCPFMLFFAYVGLWLAG